MVGVAAGARPARAEFVGWASRSRSTSRHYASGGAPKAPAAHPSSQPSRSSTAERCCSDELANYKSVAKHAAAVAFLRAVLDLGERDVSDGVLKEQIIRPVLRRK